MSTRNLIGYTGGSQITCSLASLSNTSTRESNVISNISSLNTDFLVSLTFTIASGTPSTTGSACNIYANGSNDGFIFPIIQLSSGATHATGTGDSSVGTLGSPPNVRLIGSFGLQTTTSSSERTFTTEPFSVASAFGGNMPPSFSVMVENQTGVVFSVSTGTNAQYLEVNGIISTSGN